MPRQIRPRAGAATTPATGMSFSISAMLTRELVEIGEEFAGAVERVDDERSVRPIATTGRFPVASSDTHGDAGHQPRQPFQDDGLRGVVGRVTGERSGLSRGFRFGRGTARMAAAAREAISVRPSSSPDLVDSRRHHAPISLQSKRDLSHRPLTLDARIA